jgi:hypothetical protein
MLRGHVMDHPIVPLFDALILLEHEVIPFHVKVCPVRLHLFSLAASRFGDRPVFRVYVANLSRLKVVAPLSALRCPGSGVHPRPRTTANELFSRQFLYWHCRHPA